MIRAQRPPRRCGSPWLLNSTGGHTRPTPPTTPRFLRTEYCVVT
jgi:hypothetical protein